MIMSKRIITELWLSLYLIYFYHRKPHVPEIMITFISNAKCSAPSPSLQTALFQEL